MPRSEFKIVFEFFERSKSDTSGQAEIATTPHMRKKVNDFMCGKMSEKERAEFFRELRRDSRTIEFMAKQIKAKKVGRGEENGKAKE
jgi:hypothetical protein